MDLCDPIADESVDEFGNLTGTYGTTTLTDSEAQTLRASYRVDQLNLNLEVITRHYHLSSFRQSDLTGNIHSTDVELRTIVVVERSVTATFLFLQDINGSLELTVRFNATRVSQYHTTLNLIFVDTTEEQTYVITCLTLIQQFAEHLNAGYNALLEPRHQL